MCPEKRNQRLIRRFALEQKAQLPDLLKRAISSRGFSVNEALCGQTAKVSIRRATRRAVVLRQSLAAPHPRCVAPTGRGEHLRSDRVFEKRLFACPASLSKTAFGTTRPATSGTKSSGPCSPTSAGIPGTGRPPTAK